MNSRIFLLSLLLLSISSSISAQVDLIIPIGHTDRINSICLTGNNKYLASAGTDYKVKIWDVATGRELITFYEHNRPVNAVLFTPDGSRLISGDDEGLLFFRDMSSFRSLKKVNLGSEIFCMDISPDGKLLAVGMWKIIHIFDVASMQEIRSIAAYSGPDRVSDVVALDFSDDSKTLISAGNHDPRLKLWNATTGGLLKTLQAVSDENNTAVITGDGRFVLTSGGSDDDSLFMYDLTANKLLWSTAGSTKNICKARFSPDGSQVVTSDENWEARLWDSKSGTLIRTFAGHHDDVADVCFDHTGNFIFTASDDLSIRTWNVTSGMTVKTFNSHSRNIFTVDVASDNKRVLIGGGSYISRYGNHLIIWDMAGTSGIRTLLPDDDIPGDIQCARFSPDGTVIASAAGFDNEKLRFWDAASGKCTRFIKKAHYREINSLCWSADGKFVYTAGDDAEIGKWDAATGSGLGMFSGADDDLFQVSASADGKYVAAAGDGRKVFLWNTSGNLIKTMNHDDDLNTCAISHDGTKVLAGSRFGIIRSWSVPGGNLIATLNAGTRAHSVSSACFGANDRSYFSGGMDNNIAVWDVASATIKHTIKGHDMRVTDVAASADGTKLISGSADNTVKVWNLKDNSLLATLVVLDSVDWVVSTPDNYYFCSKNALGIMGFRKGAEVFPFEQFDLQYNRPDIVLDRIGYAPKELINSLKKAYQKRLRKMKFDESMFSPDFHMPELTLINKEKLPINTSQRELSVDININDSKYKLDRINVWINDVPVYGMNGIDLRLQAVASTQKMITLQLSQGANKVQLSCLNEKGIESLRQTFEINCQPAKPVTPDLYVIAISVSDYKDDRFNLKYAAKDGRDLATLFSGETQNGGKVYIDTLFNKNATRDNILALRQKLMTTKVDDRVILYVSGHGLLDDSLDFYFATYDMNFSKPAQAGILYDDLEGLLDGIPAREKLMLMDACHSGEVDKEEVFEIKDTGLILADGAKGDLKAYGYKGVKIDKQNGGIGLQNSFELMQEVFANLSRGSGAVVISAAAGTGFALESAEWNNGVFTYCVLDGLKNKSADRDNNGSVTVGELKSFVSTQVEKLTQGAQKPTSRRESPGFDWNIW